MEKNQRGDCFGILISLLEMLYFVNPQNKMIKIEAAVGLTEALEKNS